MARVCVVKPFQSSAGGYAVPYRVAYIDGAPRDPGSYWGPVAPRGDPKTHGDAGWTVAWFDTLDAALDWIRGHRAAEMPCWRRHSDLINQTDPKLNETSGNPARNETQ